MLNNSNNSVTSGLSTQVFLSVCLMVSVARSVSVSLSLSVCLFSFLCYRVCGGSRLHIVALKWQVIFQDGPMADGEGLNQLG